MRQAVSFPKTEGVCSTQVHCDMPAGRAGKRRSTVEMAPMSEARLPADRVAVRLGDGIAASIGSWKSARQ
jgi:hypothetical protein